MAAAKKSKSAPAPQLARARASSPRPRRLALTVDTVVLGVHDAALRVLLVRRGGKHHHGEWALPGGFVDPEEPLDVAARRELVEETGLRLDPAHVEQLRAYGDPGRDDRRDQRVVSVAYLAILSHLPELVAGSDAAAVRWEPVTEILDGTLHLAFDHAAIVGDAVARVRDAIGHTALATAFCPAEFTEAQLRAVYEAVWGVGRVEDRTVLDAPNFHRSISTLTPPLVERVPEKWASTGGRPAAVYRASDHVLAQGPVARLERPVGKPPAAPAERRVH